MTSFYRSTSAKQDKDGGRDGISINQFVSIAVAEKLAIIFMQAETYFAERIARADLEAFDQLMSRSGRQAPRGEDEV